MPPRDAPAPLFMAPLELENEAARLEILHALQILDTKPESTFDDVVQAVSRCLDVPIALVSLVGSDRQWFKARVGLEIEQTPRDVSLCGHAIHHRKMFLVSDAARDLRFALNPLVLRGPKIRAYAGAVLSLPRAHGIGTLCAIDTRPRAFTHDQLFQLRRLADFVETVFAVRSRTGILSTQTDHDDQVLPG
ncbi:MAG: GAF domain-containing protein [Myxococcota bacterium]